MEGDGGLSGLWLEGAVCFHPNISRPDVTAHILEVRETHKVVAATHTRHFDRQHYRAPSLPRPVIAVHTALESLKATKYVSSSLLSLQQSYLPRPESVRSTHLMTVTLQCSY